METDLADHPGAAPELRLVAYTYRELFGHPPHGVWHAPGTVTLLADGPLRLTVAARWGAAVAAGPRGDGLIEAIRMSRPDERVTLTLAEAAAGAGPSWAGTALRRARAGATLLVSTDLPDGSGLGAAAATQTAIALALRDLDPRDLDLSGLTSDAGATAGSGHRAGYALLGDRPLPFDLDAANLRLMVIDTRVRDVPQHPVTEHAPVWEAAAVLEAGRADALGPMLTAANNALAAAQGATLSATPPAGPSTETGAGEAQQIAVSAALDAGALGARMLVDGPGRPACALLRAPLLTDVRRAIVAAFSARGLRIPRLLTVAPAAGPRRAG
jgi:galactokinase